MAKAKAQHAEEHENAERWLLTYADLITLLLAVFVVLYSSSEQDTAKFKKIMGAMVQQFNPSAELKMGPGAGLGNAKDFSLTKDGKPLPEPAAAGKEAETLESIQKELLGEKDFGKGLSAKMTEQGLVINVEEKLLFDSGRTEFRPGAREVLSRLSAYLKKVPNPIRINGHTDNVPIHTARFPSNWHLSSARAIKTAEFLIMDRGLPMQRIHVAGYADNAPAADNATEEGRAKNRRVEIVLVKGEKPEAAGPAKEQAHG